MKRQDIITKLINEGFAQKTLVNLTDKQLGMLAERVLSEQYTTTTTTSPSIVNIPKTDLTGINAAKAQKKTFSVYEGDVKEDELKGAEKKKDPTEKEVVLKRIIHKIESKIKKGECIKSEIELIKRMHMQVPEKYQKYIEAKKEKVKEPVSENKKVKKWVNKLVESKVFTSKNEIMSLIQKKLNEQEIIEPEVETLPDFLTYDSIKSSEPATKPVTKPTTKPGTKPSPRTPFQPGPGPKHNPKASMEEDKK